MASKKGMFKAENENTITPASNMLAKASGTGATTDDKEVKSVRVNLLFKPSVKDSMDKLAKMKQTSLNNLIGEILEAYINEEDSQKLIEKYNDVFN